MPMPALPAHADVNMMLPAEAPATSRSAVRLFVSVNVHTCFAGSTGILVLELLHLQIAILSQEFRATCVRHS